MNEGDQFYEVIQTAYSFQLISGYENGTFKPNQKLTREEAMFIMSRAIRITGLSDKLSDQLVVDVLRLLMRQKPRIGR